MPSEFIATVENLQELISAFYQVPIETYLHDIMFTASRKAQARLALRPPPMGVTPQTSGLSSTGNTPTAGRSFYRRGFGSFYVRSKLNASGKRKRAFRRSTSHDISHSWSISSSMSGLMVEVKSNDVGDGSYVGVVLGGKNDNPKQSDVMRRRGWIDVDTVAMIIEEDLHKIAGRYIQDSFRIFLRGRGISTET